MNNEININDIVKIEQMPKVFSQLEMIGKYIDENVKDIDKLECTEENKQEVKKRRTEINNTLRILEDKRKEIKNTLLEPYNTFNEKYESECKGKLEDASNLLKNKIDVIEETQRNEKIVELKEFAEQHFEANNIQNIVAFEDINLNVTLSASMSSLKDKIVEFCEKVSKDLELIRLEEFSDEILLEYKKDFDLTNAKLTVITRHKQLEEIQQQNDLVEKIVEEERQNEELIKEIIEEVEEIITVSFKVSGTKTKLQELKQFLIDGGYEYE